MPTLTGGRRRNALSSLAGRLVPTRNPAGAIYGTVICAAVIADSSIVLETLREVVVATSLTLVTYWLAHAYAQQFGRRLDEGGHLRLADMAASLVREFSMVEASVLPLLVLILAYSFGAGIANAVWAALAAAVLLLCWWGLLAARRATLSVRDQLVSFALAGAIGVAVIVSKVLVSVVH